jgi:hypothetical protein
MNYQSFNFAPTALDRVRARFHPGAVAERIAEAFERRPIAFSLFCVIAPAIAVTSGLGVRGATGFPLAIALIVGFLGIAFQCGLYIMSRYRQGPRLRIWFILGLLIAWNAASLAAGLVALRPDAMGRAFIERQLAPVLAETERRATTLETLSLRFDALAKDGAYKAALETGTEGQTYAPTCPGSAGQGDGPISTWRRQSSERAAAQAATLRDAAAAARSASMTASKAARSYALDRHDAVMNEVAGAVAAINGAGRSADLQEMDAFLGELDTATRPGATCPDTGLQNLTAAVRAVKLPPTGSRVAFVAPPRPSEKEAVEDLWTQILALTSGSGGDFSLYVVQLLLSPILDMILFTFLGMILPPTRRDDDDLAVALRLGLGEDDVPFLPDAFQAVTRDAAWTGLVDRTEQVNRKWRRVTRVAVDRDDWGLLMWFRHLASLGKVYDSGEHEGRRIFVLRPNFLPNRFDQLVRRWLSQRDTIRVSNIAPKPESFQ